MSHNSVIAMDGEQTGAAHRASAPVIANRRIADRRCAEVADARYATF